MGTGPLPVSDPGLFPAEHRALRELHAMARQLGGHWSRLGERVGDEAGEVLERGAAATRELLGELETQCAAHGLYGFPAAQGVGGSAAGLRGVSDLLLERNQALRSAVLDMTHVTLLLGYLAELAEHRQGTELAASTAPGRRGCGRSRHRAGARRRRGAGRRGGRSSLPSRGRSAAPATPMRTGWARSARRSTGPLWARRAAAARPVDGSGSLPWGGGDAGGRDSRGPVQAA